MSKSFRIIIWLIVNGLVFLFYPLEYGRHGGPDLRRDERQCFYNQISLLMALEMYNMDQKKMINELNEKVIDTLEKEKYLKPKITYPKSGKCKYLNHGDLTEKGTIYCEYHGSADYKSNKANGVPPSKEYEKDNQEKLGSLRTHYIKHIAPGVAIFIITTVIAFFI